jgi:hypothetical protein
VAVNLNVVVNLTMTIQPLEEYNLVEDYNCGSFKLFASFDLMGGWCISTN